MPDNLACSAVTLSYPGGLISHCVSRLFLCRTDVTSVKSGVGSRFFGGGVSAFAPRACAANSS